MEQAIKKADALIEAMEYIRLFRDKIILVKLGGSILNEPILQKKLLRINYLKVLQRYLIRSVVHLRNRRP